MPNLACGAMDHLPCVKKHIVTQDPSPSTFYFLFCLELATITLVGLAIVNSRLRDLRLYETRREHERLLFPMHAMECF